MKQDQGSEKVKRMIHRLQSYRGQTIRIMEVCGSHTASIERNGIRDILPDGIELISGPGCPVCVTPSSYIDRLIDLSFHPETYVVTFGDLLRVPGSYETLNQAKGRGGNVIIVYSPMDMIRMAKENPQNSYVFAAIGFETTTPVYALLIEHIESEQIQNIKFLTSLKTMPQAIEWLCSHQPQIQGFLAPGHVCVITGSEAFLPLAKKYHRPFAVAGFEAEDLLVAISGLVDMMLYQKSEVHNYYPSVVTQEGNRCAQQKVATYFEPTNSVWRGMGEIEGSGMVLRPEYEKYDAGSRMLLEDHKLHAGCICGQILTGIRNPSDCSLFGSICHPSDPKGACMVSVEGSCYQRYQTNAVPMEYR